MAPARGHPDGFPAQLELKTERFGMAFSIIFDCTLLSVRKYEQYLLTAALGCSEPML